MMRTEIERMDLVIHPDCSSLEPGYTQNGQITNYEDRLHSVVEGSGLAVLLHDPLGTSPSSPDKGTFWDDFKEDNRVMTALGDGRLSSIAQCAKLWQIIDDAKPKKIVIHGSYLYACVSGITGNLATALASSEPRALNKHTTYADMSILRELGVALRFGTTLDHGFRTVFLKNIHLLYGEEYQPYTPKGRLRR